MGGGPGENEMIEITSQFQITNALRGVFSQRCGGCGPITPAESYFRLCNAATYSADSSVLKPTPSLEDLGPMGESGDVRADAPAPSQGPLHRRGGGVDVYRPVVVKAHRSRSPYRQI